MTQSKTAPNKTLIILKVKLIFRGAGLLYRKVLSFPTGTKIASPGEQDANSQKESTGLFLSNFTHWLFNQVHPSALKYEVFVSV